MTANEILARANLTHLQPLLATSEQSTAITEAMRLLFANNLLNETTFNLLLKFPVEAVYLAQAFGVLANVGILTQDNLELIGSLDNASAAMSLAFTLKTLYDYGILLNLETRSALVNNSIDCFKVCFAINQLQHYQLFNAENFALLMQHGSAARELALAFITLSESNLLDSHKSFILQSPEKAIQLAEGLERLKKANLLTENNHLALLKISKNNIIRLIDNMAKLRDANLSITENLDTLIHNTSYSYPKYAGPYRYSDALSLLKQHQMLNQESYDELSKNLDDPISWAEDYTSKKQYEDEIKTTGKFFHVYVFNSPIKIGTVSRKEEAHGLIHEDVKNHPLRLYYQIFEGSFSVKKELIWSGTNNSINNDKKNTEQNTTKKLYETEKLYECINSQNWKKKELVF